jgi:hypothetical protein
LAIYGGCKKTYTVNRCFRCNNMNTFFTFNTELKIGLQTGAKPTQEPLWTKSKMCI